MNKKLQIKPNVLFCNTFIKEMFLFSIAASVTCIFSSVAHSAIVSDDNGSFVLKKEQPTSASEVINKLKSLGSNVQIFKQNDVDYLFYPELRAHFQVLKVNDTVKKSAVSVSKPFIATSNFLIYRENIKLNTDESLNKAENKAYGSVSYPVVYNKQTKQFGVLRGHFIVKIRDGFSFKNDNFKIAKKYTEHKVYTINIPSSFPIQQSLDLLKKDNAVENVLVEINHLFNVPL